ncbi:TetR/AcrR family transcriptional regulator C-terminal domain-containing protein [Niameybacter massiliensis]|uniref:TetR/AcrR family transcriptional regulator C-terminal domain-containing protein n=1 Tax=Holtiella tumoricola TaxID=3018743 RepID=A0AA42DR36_9FIRM|nr:TetR/AcrR family transcriptional regulator C-terminal domain-containing protein [Holtiella tumoricola]MDA3733755.1 TetR/AcrR family transcriptional regulator C-terminal domain-containing protein [Holtiella tumoricola]
MGEKKQVKEQLAEGFRTLMLEYPFEKITIKMITDKAGLMRPTFYNHFADKYEVLEWICREELFNGADLLLKNKMPDAAMQFLFTKLEKEREFYLRAIKTEGQNGFEQIFCENTQRVLQEAFELYAGEGKSGAGIFTAAGIAQYYAQGLTFIIKEWFHKGLTLSGEEMAKNYRILISHSLVDIVEQIM